MSWDQILANTIQSTFHFEKASTTTVSVVNDSIWINLQY